ncbi:hypothetical protein UVI_02027820 [Ustilaginoidea virens]|uniref:Carboxypeptidase n=1 Tax=Ustilaginoidea virens TaxID=1159556 RepID=A0A1B5KVF3_USTVR|nr:hypothetical protein UVI_02027820 [Ustilaginoidea virens]
MHVRLAALLVALGSQCLGQFPDSNLAALNLTVVRSPADGNVTISYKEPQGVCKTAFNQQKQYTGWVHLPTPFPSNLFFWFVEARQKTDSLTIWLNGGPGSSSLLGFFAGNGPCQVIEKGLNSYETMTREWGWDRASNMLFIDQPNHVGFSYDKPTNGTLHMLKGNVRQPPTPQRDSASPWVYLNGTFSSGNANTTANTTQTAALAVWHVIQGFLTTFPQYQNASNTSIPVSIFSESYGGRYGPLFAETWEEQNHKRLSGELNANATVAVQLSSLGIVNGCVDQEIQVPYYPVFASTNTYGYAALADGAAKFYSAKFSAPDGCQQKLRQCFGAALAQDAMGRGNNPQVNTLCAAANNACLVIQEPYYSSGRSPYDLAAAYYDPNPALQFLDYLNQGHILQAIGSPVNYTMASNAVLEAFQGTGDQSRGGNIKRLADLLDRGIRIGLIYGDRDYICNWYGGEAVALAIANQSRANYASRFPAAGYAPIIVNDSYIGGVVRQYGNLSFSRVYQAGHSVAWYQPETAFQVFARIMMGTSVSTGEIINLAAYNTSGLSVASHVDTLPATPASTCYIHAFPNTCDNDAQSLVSMGAGVVINGILYSKSADWPLATTQPTSSTVVGKSTSKPETLTGVFTATETPGSRASALCFGSVSWVMAVALASVPTAVGLF